MKSVVSIFILTLLIAGTGFTQGPPPRLNIELSDELSSVIRENGELPKALSMFSDGTFKVIPILHPPI
ncbi:hypothetical protein K8I28_14670, partial [bacterium]|nr:hypothetical protein [bacterium]